MSKYSDIAKIIKQIHGKEKVLIFPCEVTEVKDTECQVKIGNKLLLNDVRLCSVVNNDENNLIITPKIGSQVLVMDMSNGDMRDLFIVKYSEVDTITINGGKLGGLIKIEELTKKINDLVSWCKNHTHSNANFSGTISGNAAEGTLTIPAPIEAPTELKVEDYEDKKILH